MGEIPPLIKKRFFFFIKTFYFEINCEINTFSSSCWPQLLAPNYCNIFSQGNSSEISPIMPEEFGEHLIRDHRPYRISPDPSDSQLYVSTSSLQFTSFIFCRVQIRGQGQPW